MEKYNIFAYIRTLERYQTSTRASHPVSVLESLARLLRVRLTHISVPFSPQTAADDSNIVSLRYRISFHILCIFSRERNDQVGSAPVSSCGNNSL